MGAVFDVAEEDLVGELTEDEALEACGEVGIAVTKGTLATRWRPVAFMGRGGGGGAGTREGVFNFGGGWCFTRPSFDGGGRGGGTTPFL
eukprot:COSAG04_NODE_3669_length_2618_cov_5.502580_4_plen_89_part_00